MSYPKLGVMCDNCVRRGCGEEWKLVYSFKVNCFRYAVRPGLSKEKEEEEQFEQTFGRYFSSRSPEDQRRILEVLRKLYES